MSLEAYIQTDAAGNIIVRMDGGLNYENSNNLRSELRSLANENPMSKITIDLNCVDFVGSSGIGYFVETINVLCESKDQFRLANVKKEFLQVFKLYNLKNLENVIADFESDETDINTDSAHGRTFEN